MRTALDVVVDEQLCRLGHQDRREHQKRREPERQCVDGEVAQRVHDRLNQLRARRAPFEDF